MQNFQSYQRSYCTAKPLGDIVQDGNTSLKNPVVYQSFNNATKRMKPPVTGNENSIIINACYWDFLQVSFHCGIFHQCPMG